MVTEYPELIASMLEKIEAYKARSISLEELKTTLWNATEMVGSFEERDLRHELQQAEGQLDMIQFTTGEQDVFDETLKVIERIESSLRRAAEAG